MQLKRKAPAKAMQGATVGSALATATCTLLGTATPGVVEAQDIGEWQVDTAGLYYSESDGRVQDLSLSIFARTQPIEDNYLNLTLTFDTLSGASPNGAAPSASGQVIPRPISLTRSSGGTVSQSGGNLNVPAGELPVDPSFQDTRFAGSVDWQLPMGRLTVADFGASLSSETDYKHIGLSTRVARDINSRNTTLSAGLALSEDRVDPVGGAPEPFAPVVEGDPIGNAGGESEEEGEGEESFFAGESKQVYDGLLGVTQVLGRHTIAQLNYGISRSNGYLTDPYKMISVVDPVTGEVAPGPDEGTGLYLYEKRPDTRQKQSLFAMLKRDFDGDVLEASYRYMTDDWGIHSQTVDLHYRWNFSDSAYFQPHLRLYHQTAADFYRTVLLDGAPLPEFATADYRLGEFHAVTLGLKYGMKTRSGEFSGRVELYHQMSKPNPEALVGSLRDVDLTPDLTAIIVQLSYRFDW